MKTENHNEFMKKAIELARKNFDELNGGPFGAIIVKDNTIVGKGYNHVIKNNDPTAHAEVLAIRDACKNLQTYDLKDCIIYTSCEPCPMCLGAIYWSGIQKIYYAADRNDAEKAGFNDSFIYKEFSIPKENRSIPLKMIGEKNGKELFKDWILSGFNLTY